ncbi:hypothetical protein C0J52_25164, partial [Blattella germanica]
DSETSVSEPEIARTSLDDNTEQHDNTFPDSLNHLSSQEAVATPFPHTTNIITCSSSVVSENQNSVYQTSETQAFPWHSSSSEYFDSINNSGSAVFQNSSLIRSFSYYQDQYLPTSAQREGLAECDSLEKEAVGVELSNILAESGKDSEKYKMDATSSRNLWMKADNAPEW